jgi:hypothetical protein
MLNIFAQRCRHWRRLGSQKPHCHCDQGAGRACGATTQVVSPAHAPYCEPIAACSTGSVPIEFYFALRRILPFSGDFFCLQSAVPVTGPWTGL